MSNTVEKNKVISIAYTLRLKDGEIVDYSEAGDPLEYLHGADNIVPGLERELVGMKVGDSKNVVVAAADGYGEYEQEQVESIDRQEFPKDAELKLGMEVGMQDDSGNIVTATISEIGPNHVKLDFNHPLAGKELHFAIEVVGVRDASDEELEFGQPESMFEYDEFEDDEDFDEFEDDDDYEDDDDDEDQKR
jgi:FKBP-type peptidyl-prolyl cis-trans isomerase SlyD